jgi:hypothetical protein
MRSRRLDKPLLMWKKGETQFYEPEFHFTHANANNLLPHCVFFLIALSQCPRSNRSTDGEKVRKLERGN